MSNPGGTFSTGPSTSPVLSEPAQVVGSGAPTGPAPQTGPLSAYVDAQASTMADKTALLSSIAQLGSVGKQTFVQQQAQTQAVRSGAINASLQASGVAPSSAPDPGIAAAFAGQQASSAAQQGNLDQYNNSISSAAGNWYNRVGQAVPIMQERTSQQVNSFYAAQRLEAQRAATVAAQDQALKQAQIEVALANAASANSRTEAAGYGVSTAASNAAAAASRAQGANYAQMAAKDRADAAASKYGAVTGPQVAAANKAIGQTVQDYYGGPGSKDETVLWDLLGTPDSNGKPLNYGETMAAVQTLFGRKDPRVAGVNQSALEGFIGAYFRGSPPPKSGVTGTSGGNSPTNTTMNLNQAAAAALARYQNGGQAGQGG